MAKRDPRERFVGTDADFTIDDAPPKARKGVEEEARDDHGRWSAGGAGGEAAGALTAQAFRTGGFSYRPGAQSPKVGYMVSLDRSEGHNVIISLQSMMDATHAVDVHGPVVSQVKDWLKKNVPVASSKSEHYLGGWVKYNAPEQQPPKIPLELHLDMSERMQDRQKAIASGVSRNQEAVWHLDGKEGEQEISTGGTGR